MNITRDQIGRYVAQLYLSQPDGGDFVDASVTPKQGYSLYNIAFEFGYGRFIQSSQRTISKLDGGWKLLDALNIAAGRNVDIVQNSRMSDIYSKQTNPTHQEVRANRRTLKNELGNLLPIMPIREGKDYEGNMLGREYMKAEERHNLSNKLAQPLQEVLQNRQTLKNDLHLWTLKTPIFYKDIFVKNI